MILEITWNCFYHKIKNSAWGLIDFTKQSLWLVFSDKIVFDFKNKLSILCILFQSKIIFKCL